MDVELKAIRHALALARTRNFARAAEIVHVTQPALSRSIASLERSLGVRLFDRLPTGVEPTAFGELLIARGEKLVSDALLLRREIERLSGLDTGTLTVGAGPYIGEALIARASARLLAIHPRLTLILEEHSPPDIVAAVADGRFDVGIASLARVASHPQLEYKALRPRPVHFMCRPEHPLTGRSCVSHTEVFRYPLAAAVMTGAAASFAHDVGAPGRIDARSGDFTPSIQVSTLSFALQIVRTTDAVMTATRLMVSDELAAHRLAVVSCELALPPTTPCVFHQRRRTLSPAAARFIELLQQIDVEITEAALEPAAARQEHVAKLRAEL